MTGSQNPLRESVSEEGVVYTFSYNESLTEWQSVRVDDNVYLHCTNVFLKLLRQLSYTRGFHGPGFDPLFLYVLGG